MYNSVGMGWNLPTSLHTSFKMHCSGYQCKANDTTSTGRKYAAFACTRSYGTVVLGPTRCHFFSFSFSLNPIGYSLQNEDSPHLLRSEDNDCKVHSLFAFRKSTLMWYTSYLSSKLCLFSSSPIHCHICFCFLGGGAGTCFWSSGDLSHKFGPPYSPAVLWDTSQVP